MADLWGANPVPLVAPTGSQATTDPCLSYLLDYLKAFLVTDQNATAAWQVAGISPATPPVVGAFLHNPAHVVFNTKDLPALYLWRESGSIERIADDYWIHTSDLKLLWVFPLATQANQKPRYPYVNGLVNAIVTGIERGRTPSWKVAGDTDPLAASAGSNLYTWAAFWRLLFTRWENAKLHLDDDPRGPVSFAGVQMTFELKENRTYGMDQFDPMGGVDQTIKNSNGAAVDEFIAT